MVKAIENIRETLKVDTLKDNFKRVRHAGLGAAVIIQEEVVDLVDRFIERGQAAETEGVKLFDKYFGKRKDGAKKAVNNIGEELDTRWTKVLGHLNLTTKSDIDELTKHLDKLSKKMDTLGKKKQS
jgi:poly(hydroxyalkanoate) granule-associated protein